MLFPKYQYLGLVLGFFGNHIPVFNGVVIDLYFNTGIFAMNMIKKLHEVRASWSPRCILHYAVPRLRRGTAPKNSLLPIPIISRQRSLRDAAQKNKLLHPKNILGKPFVIKSKIRLESDFR
jgi:hypothetical protein